MTTIAGASQYRVAAILSNEQGLTSVSSGLIEGFGAVDMLDVGRSLYGNNGIGLSSSARKQTKEFLQQSASGFNGLFSAGVSETSSVDALKTQINALRASLPASAVRGSVVDEDA